MTTSSGGGSVSVTVNAEGAYRKFATAEAKINEKVVMGLNKIGVLTVSKLKAKAPRDTSNMVNHIHALPATPGNLNVEIIGDASYTVYVDKGTAPHMPPSDVLDAWGVRHGFPPGSGFIIARAISKHGTKATNFIEDIIVEARVNAKMIMLESTKGLTL
jgi:hypothetical protein